jgi:hypothetical protein
MSFILDPSNRLQEKGRWIKNEDKDKEAESFPRFEND